MKKISLSGVWKIIPSQKVKKDDLLSRDYIDTAWLEIAVPSHWQTHPSLEYYPEEVYYRKKFVVSKDAQDKIVRLRFKGVFYYCKVWLNGDYLGSHEGYFSPFSYEVTDKIRYNQENILVCEVGCPWEKDLGNKKIISGVFSHWDCKDPQAQPGGIWQDVELITTGPAYFEDGEVTVKSLSKEEAKALLKTEIISSIEQEAEINYSLSPCNFEGKTIEIKERKELKKGLNTLFKEVDIDNPQLWWTHDQGRPNLYNLKVEIPNSDSLTFNFGLRKVEFKDWHFYLNGRRIFIRGTNYAPADIRLSEAKKELYEKDFQMIKDANMNMVRVHAHVDKEELYEVCDHEGILLWQDFPLQWGYAKSIESEAKKQIREMINLLKNHPSIALWCCHNEPFFVPATDPEAVPVWEGAKILFSVFAYNWNKDVLDKRLEKEAKKTDRSRPVIKASGLWGIFWRGMTDSHLYFGWYQGKMHHLRLALRLSGYRLSRFITEYGAQSFPELKNFQEIDPSPLKEIDWKRLKKRYLLQKVLMEKKSAKAKEYANLSDYIQATQEYQARLNKYHIETFRRLKYSPCGGTLQFMFADCSPGISWSIVDYWRTPKLSYQTVKNSFNPLYIMADWPKDKYRPGERYKTNIYLINDKQEEFTQAKVYLKVLNPEGKVVLEKELALNIKKDSLKRIDELSWAFPKDAKGIFTLQLKLDVPGQKLVENSYPLKVEAIHELPLLDKTLRRL